MITAALIAVLVGMTLVMIRGVLGPHIFDRVLAANSFGTYILVLIALIGELFDTLFFLDIAIIYALINFITTIGMLRYVQYKQNQGNIS